MCVKLSYWLLKVTKKWYWHINRKTNMNNKEIQKHELMQEDELSQFCDEKIQVLINKVGILLFNKQGWNNFEMGPYLIHQYKLQMNQRFTCVKTFYKKHKIFKNI